MSKVQRFWSAAVARNIRCVREDDFDALEVEAQALREEVAALRAKLSDLPGWLRSIYEWGYVGGQNNPNGYIDEEDRDKWVNDILVRNHISP